MSALWMPAQPVDATQALNLSAGVSNCKVSRGRSFIRQLDYRPEPAAVRLVFWPCSVVQPVPGLFVGPTGNSVALRNCKALARAQVALGRFGVMHRRGVGRSTQSGQQA